MFPYTKLELCDLIARSHFEFPQIVRSWDYGKDDGFGNLIDTVDMCAADFAYTNYVINYLGYDSIHFEFPPCQYGDH